MINLTTNNNGLENHNFFKLWLILGIYTSIFMIQIRCSRFMRSRQVGKESDVHFAQVRLDFETQVIMGSIRGCIFFYFKPTWKGPYYEDKFLLICLCNSFRMALKCEDYEFGHWVMYLADMALVRWTIVTRQRHSMFTWEHVWFTSVLRLTPQCF